MKTENKVVLVSGGSRGIGKSIIEHLLNNDFIVASFSRHKPEIQEDHLSEQKLARFTGRAIDAIDNTSLNQFLNEIISKYGKIDALINNAAINYIGLFSLMNDKLIEDVIDVNVKSVIHLSKMVISKMIRQNSGIVINISSIMAHGGYKGSVVYGASKAAIDGFTRGLARELGEKNIRVNSVAPGYIQTDMTKEVAIHNREKILSRTPLKRLGTTSDLIGTVDFLLSDASKHITGQRFVIDGGLTC